MQHWPKEGTRYDLRIDFSQKSWFKPLTKFPEMEHMIYKRMMREGVLDDEQRCSQLQKNEVDVVWMASLSSSPLPPSLPSSFRVTCGVVSETHC